MHSDDKFELYLMGRKQGFMEGWQEARMQFLLRGVVPPMEIDESAPEEGPMVSEQ